MSSEWLLSVYPPASMGRALAEAYCRRERCDKQALLYFLVPVALAPSENEARIYEITAEWSALQTQWGLQEASQRIKENTNKWRQSASILLRTALMLPPCN